MRIEAGEFMQRLQASPPGRAIVKDYLDQITARRQKAIDENEQAQKKAIAAVAAIRARIPAADTVVAAAEKAFREAQQHRMRLEDEMLEAEAPANAVARRTRAELLETAPACIDQFIAEAHARREELCRRDVTVVSSATPMKKFLGAEPVVETDLESLRELAVDCVEALREAETLKETVAGEANALAAIAKLRSRIGREPELRRVFPQPERAA